MLLLFSDKMTPRLQYVCNWIFSQWGIKYTSTASIEDFKKYKGAKVCYSKHSLNDDNTLGIVPEGLVQDDSLTEKEVTFSEIGSLPVIFKNGGDLGFDIFSAVFYMISRYEEYLPFEPDAHGRFPASSSFAHKNGFLETPIVELWNELLKTELKKKFPELTFHQEHFQAFLTYDIDVAFKYSGRSILHTILAGGRDLLTLQWKRTWQRLQVVTGRIKDPWDVYEYLQNSISGSGLKAMFFILSGDRSKFDKNLLPGNPVMETLLHEIEGFARIGLHPSYTSSILEEKIFLEKIRLEEVLNKKVTISRQHFVKFKFPSTFEKLEQAGIKEDFSVSFPDAPGFRAGTSKSFYFYDLKNERETTLKLFPSCWMDSTFIHYSNSSAEEALEKGRSLMKKVKEVNGYFVPIFHNDYLSENDWKQVHDEIIRDIGELQNSN